MIGYGVAQARGRIHTPAWPKRSADDTLPYGMPHWCDERQTQLQGALNSAVECHLHTVEVAGSNPAAPTIDS